MKFSSLMKGKKVHQDIMMSVMRVAAWNGNSKIFDWLDKRFKASESETERLNILAAMGCFGEQELIQKVLDYILTEIPDRNKFISIGYLAANPIAIPYLWEWFVSHLRDIEAFHPIHYERVIAGIIPVAGIGKEEEVKSFFNDYMVRTDKAKDVIKLSLERLEIHSKMRGT
jgi:hypothetical protein